MNEQPQQPWPGWLESVRLPDGAYRRRRVVAVAEEDPAYVLFRAREPRPSWPVAVRLAVAVAAREHRLAA